MRIERVTKKGVVTAIYRDAKFEEIEGGRTFADLGLTVYKFKKRRQTNRQGEKGSLYVVHADSFDDMPITTLRLDYIYSKGYWIEDCNHVRYNCANDVVRRLRWISGLQSDI